MLTLMALLGVTFVLYATASRQSARLAVEAQDQLRPDADPERLLAYFLGQLLFDAPDDAAGVGSALRGHSLARSMLGLDYRYRPDGTIRRDAGGGLIDDAGKPLNAVPFNGTGRQHFDPGLPFPVVPDSCPAKDDFNLVNYTWFPADKLLRDPERRGWRAGLPDPGAADNRKPFVGGFNASYTYPDLNNLFLAAVRADGRVLLPSFHRPRAGFGPLGPGNWRWTSDIDPTLSPDDPLYKVPQPWLKYLVLRPRPADMGPAFPLPEDDGGDVKNLIGGPGGNDSFWIDLGHPVVRSADGRKFKPLFAPLIVDLDGRVNLNVHGNLRGLDYGAHASNQGWGPWEVNPAQLVPLPAPGSPDYADAVARRAEYARLLSGVKPSGPGLYGWDKAPHSAAPGNRAAAPAARFYAPADFDGSREEATGSPSIVGRPTARLRLPGERRVRPWACFPAVTPRSGYGNGSVAERQDHPSLHDPFHPRRPDGAFALSDLEALCRFGDTGSQALSSSLLRLAPRNFFDPGDALGSARRRRLVTLASFDPDRPGVMPWFRTSSASDAAYSCLPPRELAPGQSPYHPSGQAVSPPGSAPDYESEFGPDGRAAAALTAARRLDLNRYLPPYPKPDETTGRITDTMAFQVAQQARQHFAAELFEVLWKAAGAGDPARMPPPGAAGHETARWDALRYLAQLAVNIVDYLDADDCVTPFNWFTDPATRKQEWVYGTELPRALLNEVYAEYVNLPDDPGLKQQPPQATKLKGNVWVELHNPLQDDPPLDAPYRKAEARLEVPAAGDKPAYAAYRIVLARLTGDLRQADNVRGEVTVTTGFTLSTLSGFAPEGDPNPPPAVDTRVILGTELSHNQGYSASPKENKGFYVVGPNPGPKEAYPFPEPLETLRRSELSYVVPANYPNLLLKPSVLLQRLCCPRLPPQPDPARPLYNPYVTVDYVRDVLANYAAEVGIDGPGAPEPTDVAERYSVGRRQPYAGHPSQLNRQEPDPALEGQPQHSFFQHNVDKTTPGPNWQQPPDDYPPFDWLVHLDRPAISVPELLHVSTFKPHELTQQFRTGDTDSEKFTHRAPWLDEGLAGSGTPQSYRLYRALEFLTTGSRLPGMTTASTTGKPAVPAPPPADAPPYVDQRIYPDSMAGVTASGGSWRLVVGSSLVIDRGLPSEEVVRVKAVGPATKPIWFEADFLRPHAAGFTVSPVTVSERVPGRINLNTVWDEEVFLALCDPTRSNAFHDETAKAAFKQLRDSRTVSGDAPAPNDRPFLSFTSAGASDAGVQGTLLRSQSRDARAPILGVPGQPHPYQTFELLTKIYNSTTVRSNVFAVWLTVGFFEVTDDTTRPVKLGAEIGRAEDRLVRHRMFAIVDRSVLLRNPGPQERFDPRVAMPSFATGPVVPYFSIID
jgi:hypothetical protein